MIEKIRVSIGSAAVLGLESGVKFRDPPTTCYIMTYIEGHCIANCGFCPQAREADSSTEKLSRISWPIYNFKDFLTKLKYTAPLKSFQRICIQTLNYKNNFKELIEIVSNIKRETYIPISTAIPPMSKSQLEELKLMGVQRVGIALDGATPEVFEKIKGKEISGPYNWNKHLECLKKALEVFSEGLVSTHLIVGLGETQKEIIERVEELVKLNILVSLFAFMPIKGTHLEDLTQPDIIDFRKIQLARYLILKKNKVIDDFTFNLKGNLIGINITKRDLRELIDETEAFETSGCPGCNRPYYTSKPSGPIYNFPRKLTFSDKEEIYSQLKRFIK
ncbi:MAG: radical SAM protein [Promethearchaeota archaeon]